jgi:hypothetical protein
VATLPTVVVKPAPKIPYEWHTLMPYNLEHIPTRKKVCIGYHRHVRELEIITTKNKVKKKKTTSDHLLTHM